MPALRRRPLGGGTATSRLLLTLVAAPLVLVGLLLIHIITSDSAAASAPAGNSVVSVGVVSSVPEAASDTGGQEPTFEELVCILALFVGTIFLALPLLLSRIQQGLAGTKVHLLDVASAQLRRPNLHVLSISRT